MPATRSGDQEKSADGPRAPVPKFGTRRKLRIIAQDPSVRRPDGEVVTAKITLPWEDLLDGPMGYAVYVMDYDASARAMYRPAAPPDESEPPDSVDELLNDPKFHALNVYAVVMRTLLRFEFALGRRIAWGIRGHQIKVVPHAFEEANAYYSPELEAVVFGYVRGDEPVFLCLSHDVVAHETAHALLDGLRDKFMAPSSADQAALHEAFADIVALLSVYSLPELVCHLLTPIVDATAPASAAESAAPEGFVRKSALSWDDLSKSALFGLAEQMRSDAADSRVNALRRSISIEPSTQILTTSEFEEEHRRGEVFVAAVMRAFLSAWVARIDGLAVGDQGLVSIAMAAEQGADIADTLLTMAIRAIDYTPPIHISFGDFLSAMLTADTEVRSDDSRYELRRHLISAMAAYGITPASEQPHGLWRPPETKLNRSGAHLGALQTDPTEMFRHIWNNRDALNLNPEAYTRVTSVRPCLRISPADGAQIHETVVECTQYLRLSATELSTYQLRTPPGMRPDDNVVLEGGSTLILDEYGDLKFEVSNRVLSRKAHDLDIAKWQNRLDYMWQRGYLDGANRSSRLAAFHLERTLTATGDDDDGDDEARRQLRLTEEAWT